MQKFNYNLRKMRIAIIVPSFPCLSETFILNQITGLIDMGCKVRVIAFGKPDEQKQHSDVSAYRLLDKTIYIQPPKSKWTTRLKAVVQTLWGLVQHPRFVYRLQKNLLADGCSYSYPKFFMALALLRNNCDIIHCHFGNIALQMLPFMDMFLQAKWITSFHGFDANSFVLEMGKDVYKDLFCRKQFYTCNTSFTRQKIVEIGCPENKIYIIPESLKVNKFLMSEKRTLKESVTILTVGRMVEKKGYEYSIRAIADVFKTHKNIRYIIAGDGPLCHELHTLVKELRLQEVVDFRGALPENEIIKLYHGSDIFLLPSVTAKNGDMEGQALVLQEAQAAELPVISTWHNGIPDGVIDTKTGFLVDERDFKAISKHLVFLIENPQKRLEMGYSGRAFVLDKYDTSIVNDKLVEVYKDMLKDNLDRR
jgi:colanic acid/amylovoran biosynthesis glycosyltransferase